MENWNKHSQKYRYMILSRMKTDCDYYLGNGNRSKNHLWAGDEKGQIDNMIALWETFEPLDRPEWLTWSDILDYAEKMGVEVDHEPGYVKYFRINRRGDE